MYIGNAIVLPAYYNLCSFCICVLGPELSGFLFQPFRKPKRIRTAFTPNQLLRLEHAFEKNHYVVGTERKQLAKTLSLSETQVSTETKYTNKKCHNFATNT